MLHVILLLLAIVFIVLATSRMKWHPFLALLVAAFGFGLLSGMDPLELVDSINAGFGGTIGYIGIVILCGTIIGTFLEKSGGAQSLAESTLKLTGQKNVPLAMGLVGYVVSLPVFCDSGFIILAPLAKAATELSNPRWGLLTRAGNDKSHLARQVERHADVYTSRVSNFLLATPFVYLRSLRGTLPHDPGTPGGAPLE